MAISALVLTVLFLSGAILVAAPAYVFGGRADHAAIALLVYAMATVGLIEVLPSASETQVPVATTVVAFEPIKRTP